MSVQSIALVLEHSTAEKVDRLVLIAIANHDGDGGSWPSVATIAREALVSERTAQRSIKALVELGELLVHRNDGGTRKTRPDRRPNRYEITIDPDSHGVTDVSPRDPEPGDSPVTPSEVDGVTETTPRGDRAVSPEPSLTTHNPPSPGKPGAIGCAVHRGRKPNCRACGTTPRQLAAKAQAEATARRRAADQAAAAAERSKPRGRKPGTDAARAAARDAAAAARLAAKEAS